MSKNYNSLIIKALENRLSDNDKQAFELWLLEGDNDVHFSNIKRIWQKSESLSYPELEEKLNVELAFQKVLKRTQFVNNKKNFRIRPYLIAASLAFIIAFTGFIGLSIQNKNQYETIYASSNMEYVLPDNSKVWLTKNAKLSFYKDFTEKRSIKMKGQVMYEVTHNPEKPFVIDADGMDVTVLGTKFIVSNFSEKGDYVHVINGKVQVDDKQGERERLILTKDMTATRSGKGLDFTKQNYINGMFWATQSLSYDNTSLENIFDELEEHFNVQIVTDRQFSECKFKGTFTNEKIDDILSTLEVIYDLEISNNSGEITINGPSCK